MASCGPSVEPDDDRIDLRGWRTPATEGGRGVARFHGAAVEVVRCREAEGGVALGFNDVDLVRVPEPDGGVWSVEEGVVGVLVEGASEVRGLGTGVLGVGGVAVFAAAARDDNDFDDADERNAGLLPSGVLPVGVVLAAAAGDRAVGVLLVIGLLATDVDLAVTEAPAGIAGAGDNDNPTGALDFALAADNVRVRNVGVDFDVTKPSAEGRGVGRVGLGVVEAVGVLGTGGLAVVVVLVATVGFAVVLAFVDAVLDDPAFVDVVLVDPVFVAVELLLTLLEEGPGRGDGVDTFADPDLTVATVPVDLAESDVLAVPVVRTLEVDLTDAMEV
jgi:hypothetical protein